MLHEEDCHQASTIYRRLIADLAAFAFESSAETLPFAWCGDPLSISSPQIRKRRVLDSVFLRKLKHQSKVMMGRHGLFFLLCSAALLFLVGAQEGFISIDCGFNETASYINPSDNLTYVSDEGFIDGGVNVRIDPSKLGKGTNMGYYTVRSFPNYKRNCYQLPATVGTKYIVRAAFLYGNYDGLNKLPSFDLYLGVDLWDTVNLTDNGTPFRTELVVQAKVSFLYVCLVRTGHGTPFISVLKLRPLTEDMYAPANTSLSLALKTIKRVDVGATKYTWYPSDRFDRIWMPDYDGYGTPYNTSETVTESGHPIFGMPSVVMQTAVYSPEKILVNWTGGIDDRFYLYLEFADVVRPADAQSRQMNVQMNGEDWGNVTVSYLQSSVLYSTSPALASQYSFSIQSVNASDEGAVLNSFEVYKALTFNGPETDARDVTAITAIKEYYLLKKNWIGDPCIPDNSPWDGLTCGNDSVPRIVALDLSNGRLSGTIVDHISKLTELMTLNLSRNNLQGPVPPFLQELPNLINIDLSGNNFSGTIPTGVQEKVKNGEVTLRIDNNPLICQQDRCNQQENGNVSSSTVTGSKGSNSATGLKNSYTVTAISVAIYLLTALCLLF